jgi:hypothetical protein
MGSKSWQLFLVGAAVIIVLCLALLEIVVDRTSLSRTRELVEPVTRPNVPEHPWTSR